jgi:hypothetical protein
MKKMLLMAAIAPLMVVCSGTGAVELPTFEVMGLPITRHQVAVMGAQDVREQSATPTLTFGGMPASPHQIAVLTPRASTMAKAAPTATTVGFAAAQ